MNGYNKLIFALIVGIFIALIFTMTLAFLLFLWGGHLDKGAY